VLILCLLINYIWKQIYINAASPNAVKMIKSKEDEMGGACSMHGEMRNA
jgi:hypothetical protein